MSSQTIPSRPKTSAGSRATSARGVRRPNTAQRNVNERPLSRTAMGSESNTVQRAVSRGPAAPLPSRHSSMGERVQSRLGTSQAVRPPTSGFRGAPPGTAIRPITQQGLTGVRAPSRLGTSRQVLDKSYYVSLLRRKSNSLLAEMEALKKELDRGERDQQNLIIYEKRAEEEASTIAELQGRLIDCNMIVDRLNTNSDLSELEEDLNELIAKNDESEASLNELFADRQQLEQTIRDVETAIETEKAKNAALISDMDIHIKDEFEALKQESVNANEEYRLKQQELTELNRRKEQLDDEMAHSALKQQAMMLHERLAEMEAKKAAIEAEINAEGTPDEQREKLMQTVIKTTDEVAAMQKQIDTVTERIDQGNEALREFENEYDGIIGEKSEKYRELKMKEMQMDEFLDMYEQHKSEQETRVAQSCDETVEMLELISENCSRTDLSNQVTGLDTTGVDAFSDRGVSADELQQLHVRLQEELIDLNEKEQQLERNKQNCTQRISQMNIEIEGFQHSDALKADAQQKRISLEKRREELEVIVPRSEKTCEDVLSQLANVQTQLNDSDEYTTLKNIQKKWQYIEQNNAASQEAAAIRDAETNYTHLKEEAMRLQEEYNATLVSLTRAR